MSQSLLSSQPARLQNENRLVVLVHPDGTDPLELSKQVRALCKNQYRQVLYLTVVREVNDHLHMLYLMNRLSASTHDTVLNVDTNVQVGIPWLQAVREIYKPGDNFVCSKNHWIPWHLFWEKPISEVLSTEFKRPVTILSKNGSH